MASDFYQAMANMTKGTKLADYPERPRARRYSSYSRNKALSILISRGCRCSQLNRLKPLKGRVQRR